MMKFFALVALTVFATASASTVASVAATRASLVAGATAPNLVLTVEASATGAIDHTTGTITAVVQAAIFAADGDTACTATSSVGGTPTGTAPTFVTAGGTANAGTVSGQGSGTETLTLTMGTTTATDILANSGTIVITCTANLLNNAATATSYSFSVSTSGDTVAASGSYTLKTTPTFTSAARGGAATNLMTGVPGGDLTMVIAPVTALPAGGTITVTPSAALFTADGATTCTASNAATSNPTFASATVSGTGGTQIITFTLGSATTDAIATTVGTTIVCTDNLAVNTAAAAITFGLVTSTDLEAATAQTGYTIVARTCPLWTSAARATLTTGVAGGDLTVIFTTTQGPLAIGETITLTPSVKLFTNDDTSTTCTVAVNGGGTAPTVTTAVTGTGTILTLTTAGQAVAAGTQVTLVCSSNLDVNTAVGDVTFSIATTQDSTTLAAQTGYTITAATSAASSTASVSMLTMLALAAVAMRQ